MLAFSVSFEMDYLNLVDMLRRADIPARAEERGEATPWSFWADRPFRPILSHGPVADAIVIGEVETGHRGSGGRHARCVGSRIVHATLATLAALPGVYVPDCTRAADARQWLRDLDDFPRRRASSRRGPSSAICT